MSLEKIKQLKADYQAAVKEAGKPAIKQLLTTFFNQFPEVCQIRWEQYTPHFNDGDVCEFQVHDPEVTFMPGQTPKLRYESSDGYFVSAWDMEDGSLRTALDALGEELNSLEDLLKEVFGDHAQITANREEIEVEEYDHD